MKFRFLSICFLAQIFPVLVQGQQAWVPSKWNYAPLFSAPGQARTLGIQVQAGLGLSDLEDTRTYANGYLLGSNIFYSVNDRFFLESQMGLSYSSPFQGRSGAFHITPGVGLRIGKRRCNFLMSAGLNLLGYKENFSFSSRMGATLNFYQRVGIQARIGNKNRVTLITSFDLRENLHYRYRSEIHPLDDPTGHVFSDQGRTRSLYMQLCFGLRFGRADRLNMLVQVNPWLFGVYEMQVFQASITPYLGAGIQIPLGKSAGQP